MPLICLEEMNASMLHVVELLIVLAIYLLQRAVRSESDSCMWMNKS